jgi:hypothetical protein
MSNCLVVADLDKGLDFVRRHGGPIDLARAAALSRSDSALGPGLEEIREAQLADGGFPAFWSGGRASLDATCFKLDQIADLGPAAHAIRDRAVSFLLARQGPDGSWEEDRSTASSGPPWVGPGDPAARLYLTANCAFWTGAADPRPAALLLGAMDASGRLPSFPHTQWLAAGVVARSGPHADQAARLLAPVRPDDLGPTALAWLAGVVPTNGAAARARDRLAGLQRPDGRWSSEDGERFDVSTTLAVVRCLLMHVNG